MLDRLLAGCLVALTLCVAGPAHALEPIRNYEDMVITTKNGETPSLQEVRQAIVTAGAVVNVTRRGAAESWDFTDSGPGKLRGMLVVRGRHVIEVDITYSAKLYSVVYANSSEMSYQAGEIHPNYNFWVKQLVDRVSTRLFNLVPNPAGGADSQAEVSFWESVRTNSNPAELQAYLDQYPNGRFAVLARNRLAAQGVAPKAASPALLAAAPAAAAPAAAPKATAPPSGSDRIPQVGDNWTYRFQPKGRSRSGTKRYLVTVTASSGSRISDVTTTEGANPSESDHSARQYIAPMDKLSLFSPYLAVFSTMRPQSQLRDIENLDPRTCPLGWSCSISGYVLNQETVTVPAGTFSAIRVDIKQVWTGPRLTHDREAGGRVLTVWYAPEIKRAVKYASRDQSAWGGTQSIPIETEFEFDLISYKLN
jgi:hypothetical protein